MIHQKSVIFAIFAKYAKLDSSGQKWIGRKNFRLLVYLLEKQFHWGKKQPLFLKVYENCYIFPVKSFKIEIKCMVKIQIQYFGIHLSNQTRFYLDKIWIVNWFSDRFWSFKGIIVGGHNGNWAKNYVPSYANRTLRIRLQKRNKKR